MSKAERDLAILDAEDGNLQDADDTLSALIERTRAARGIQPDDGFLSHELADSLVQRAGVRLWAKRLREAGTDLDEAEVLADGLKPFARQSVRATLLDTRVRLLGAPDSPLHDDAGARRTLQALRDELAGSSLTWLADASAMQLARWRGDHAEVVRTARLLRASMQQGGHQRGQWATQLAEANALLELDRPQEAEPLAAQAWAFFELPGPPDIAATSALTLARARGTAQDWPLAQTALATTEQLTRAQPSVFDQQRYLADRQALFGDALRLALTLLRDADPATVARAWQVAEQTKSFSLRQAMTQGGWLRNLDPGVDGALRELDRRLQALEAQGDASESALARRSELAAERHLLLQKSMRASPRLAASAPLAKPWDLQAVLALLPDRCGVVSWYWLRERDAWRLLVFHAGADRVPRLAQVPWSARELAALEACPRGFGQVPHPSFIVPPLPAARGDRLLPPQVLRALQGCDTLLVTPHRQLRQLPVHAMQLSGPDGQPGWLIERFAVQMLPTLALPFPPPTRAAAAVPRNVLLLGCERDGFNSSRLDDVADELRGIDEAWSAHGHRVRRHALAADEGFAAHAPLARWPDFDIIHLACHGRFVPESPLDASLYLGNEALRASELFDVALKAEVVCLSACDVGRHGDQLDGVALVSEEWLGLAMPLFQAGARHVLTSLWQADSSLASAFMQFFHEGLADRLTPAQAHRQASLRQLSRPFGLWAQWQLAGFPTAS